MSDVPPAGASEHEIGSIAWWESFKPPEPESIGGIPIEGLFPGGDEGVNIEVDAVDLDRLHADLLAASPTGKKVLIAAHQAMGEVVAERVKRYAPVDRTPPRSATSERYGPLSKRVTVHAAADEVVISSPFYARFQEAAEYIWRAVRDSLPEARQAFADVVGGHVARPGGGFLGPTGGRAAQAGRTALQLGLGVLLFRRGVVVGRLAGRLGARGVEAAIVSPVSTTFGASRFVPGAVRAAGQYRRESAVLAATRSERVIRRIPAAVVGIGAGRQAADLVARVYGRSGVASAVRRTQSRIGATGFSRRVGG